MQELEIRNNGFLKENKILKEKIKELEEKVKTKEKVRNVCPYFLNDEEGDDK